ncbi:ATP-dependent DNA helicase [Paenibacillus xylaniclasticus]|uniref:ATP-dependent DNA helicase n=1 Tax=Paenibacillus xylaniclasticus TaxID=588083 RepID=UPI00176406D8|nr:MULTISPECIES: ATP-dependent DNA helicase [Paenibacillus]GFN32110.1 ATP-dependent helicase [Paenibacillus curdlanolyticus]
MSSTTALPSVQLSVRELVEYVYRSGDIVSGFRSAAAMAEGARIHVDVQSQYGPQDEKEHYLKAEIEYDGIVYRIDGRCDGLLQSEDGMMIDEIKSMAGELPASGDTAPRVHWAQAVCYAYMYAAQHEKVGMQVRLTYVSTTSGERVSFVRKYTFIQLQEAVMDAVRAYAPYARMLQRHALRRTESAKALAFPFPSYRAGQRKLAGAVYKTITDGTKLFAQAPTGIGKTISTLFPAVKAIGEERLRQLFYLTAKTITRTAAEEAFALMQSNGLSMHVVTLTAKDKICFQEEVRCSKELCPYADGYYDRINGALLDMLDNETLMTRTVIEHYARKHRVCPFEMSLDAAYASDALIGDYNYVFDPRVNLKRMFEERKRHSVILVDEAHNLVERGREMYSAELMKAPFLHLSRSYKGINVRLQAAAKAINDWLLALRKRVEKEQSGKGGIQAIGAKDDNGAQEGIAGQDRAETPEQRRGNESRAAWTALGNGQAVSVTMPGDLIPLLETFTEEAALELSYPAIGTEAIAAEASLSELYFTSQNWVRIAKLYDERYVTMVECEKSEVRLKLFCLDPSYLLCQAGKGFRAQVFFSATLSPLSYYMDILGGGGESDYSLSVPSPFSPEQLDVRVQPLSTRYRDREQSIEPIARALLEMVSGEERPNGNTLAFFPSYDYMNRVYERFMAIVESMEPRSLMLQTIVQAGSMREEEREAFLAAFQAGNAEPLLGFAVMGGIFSEGVDLVGDRLTGVAVIGVGLPQVGLERDMIRDYCERTGRNGFDYAYVYPGMNKVLQAGGRLIRSETDQGCLLLIDDRYLAQPYNRLLPPEWKPYKIIQVTKPDFCTL